MMMIVIMLYGQLADKPTRPRVQTSYSEFCDTFEFFFGPVLMSASWCVGELSSYHSKDRSTHSVAR